MLYWLIGCTSLVAALLLWLLWRAEARRHGVTLKIPALPVVVLVMVAATSLYVVRGLNPDTSRWLADWSEHRQFAQQVVAGEPSPELAANVPLQSLARVLQRQLHLTPSVHGWYVLALVYSEMDAPQVAVTAARKAVELGEGALEPQLLLARSLIVQNGGKLDAESAQILEGLLQDQPNHDGALTLLASAAMQSKDYAKALPAWQALLSRHNQSEAKPLLEKMVAETESKLQSQLYYQDINITVAGAAGIPAGGTLFVFLRRPGDSGQPLAALRVLADRFPMEVSLSAENWLQAMPSPGTELLAGARYSADNNRGIEGALENSEPVALTGQAGQLSAKLSLPTP